MTLFDVAEDEEIDVVYANIPKTKGIALESSVCLDFSLISNPKSEKVILAHELGHCVLGAFYEESSSWIDKARAEHKASVWAIKKLLPIELIREELSKGIYEPWEMAEDLDLDESFVCQALDYWRM